MRPGRKGVSPKVHKPADLPRASFRKIDDEALTKPLGVHDLQARSYGYNNFDDFERPDHYIRYIEPIESELAVQVEYDMDEQDQEWLDAMNKERKDQAIDQVSYETFEIVMDKLEKEWFDLMKRVPKPHTDAPPEDSTCAVCDDGEGENSNAIVFCDGCNLAVHQECYGIPYIPEGQWLCRKCTISPENPVSCVLCPNEAGAFKQTNSSKWVHLLCALWNPEVTVTKGAYMEPIEGIERISKPRWKLACSLCGIKKGACIQCQKASCATAFHVTCARQQGLLGSMKSFAEEEHSLRVFCEKHLPPEMLKNRRIHSPPPVSSSGHNITQKSTKAALAHSSGYAPPAPIIPAYIYDRVFAYIGKIAVRKKKEFLASVCKYWSLKREARRGAPLLKRLHLEPWTASSANRHKTDEQKVRQLKHLHRLRADIERIRIMAEYVVRREKIKQARNEELQDTILSLLFPFEDALSDALEAIVGVDKMRYFLEPVSKVEVPDYYDIVKSPMDWTQMGEKINNHEYMNVEEFQADVNLVFDNAMLYNGPNSAYYKHALKCRAGVVPILADLDQLKPADILINGDAAADPMEVDKPSPVTVNGTAHSVNSPHLEPDVSRVPVHLRHVNNLEPSMAVLELLEQSDDLDRSELDFLLSAGALDFLYFYGKIEKKPPPTPPPPPPPKPPRDRAAEKRRKEEERERAATEREELLRQAVMLPRTRHGKKVVEAFQVEPIKDTTPAPEDEPVVESAVGPRSGRTSRRPTEESEVEPIVEDGVAEQTSSPAAEEANEADARPEEPEVTPAPADSSAEKPRRYQRRIAADAPGVPLILSDKDGINAHGQFTHFETGWVLETRTRSGRKSTFEEPPQAAASKKRARKSESVEPTSRPSKKRRMNATAEPTESPEATPAPHSHAAQSPRSPFAPLITRHAKGSPEMKDAALFSSDISDVTESEGEEARSVHKQSRENSTFADEPIMPATRTLADEPIIPATRQSSSVLEGSAPPDGPPKQTKKRQPIVSGMYGKKGSKQVTVPYNPISAEEALKIFEPGTLVWAKQKTFPWFPAELGEADAADLTAGSLKAKADAEAVHGQHVYLVYFLDKAQSWCWLPASRLYLLGEDNALDSALLDGRQFKSAHLKQTTRQAYYHATKNMQTAAERAEEERLMALIAEGDEDAKKEYEATFGDKSDSAGNREGSQTVDAPQGHAEGMDVEGGDAGEGMDVD